MIGRDHTIGLVLALLTAIVGIAAWSMKVGDAPPESPLTVVGRTPTDVRRGPPVAYRDVAALTPTILAEAARVRGAADLVQRLRPTVEPLAWEGVLDVEVGDDVDAGQLIARYEGDPDHRDGPPFHFVADADGTLTATKRWLLQRRWLVTELTRPTEWIIVVRIGGGERRGEVATLDRVLRSEGWTRGGRAKRVGLGAPARRED